jgi:enamine deaminase RidA (YjgF/YER057c/UK114 family)
MRVLLPSGWARPRGYANGVAARGEMVFVAGMVGWDAQQRFHSTTIAGQTRQALENIVEVLRTAGAKPAHIVRMTWYVLDKREYMAAAAEIGAAFREVIGSYAIAMSAVEVRGLMEDAARVEIEVTAVIPD